MINTIKELEDIEKGIESCISSLSEKFLKWPYNFFTESDAHSFLYYHMFRYGPKALKQIYKTKDGQMTVLIHREYPTCFRYSKERKCLDEKGGRGHYDLVVLNPEFSDYGIKEVIAQDYSSTTFKDKEYHLLAAIEFKLITKLLSASYENEIEFDFWKLSEALQKRQAKEGYMIVFNRERAEENFRKKFQELGNNNPKIKGIYLESIKRKERNYASVYIGNWKHKLRFKGK